MESRKYYWVIKILGPDNSNRGYVPEIYINNYLPVPNGITLEISNALKFLHPPIKLIKYFNESLEDENCTLYKAVRTLETIKEEDE